MDDLKEYNFLFDENEWTFDDNPYSNPEKCGLEIVCQIDLEEPDYSFDMQVVWKGKNGKLYTAQDRGCSCPSPFEDYHKISDFELVTPAVLDRLTVEFRSHSHITPEEGQEFFYKIRQVVLAK